MIARLSLLDLAMIVFFVMLLSGRPKSEIHLTCAILEPAHPKLQGAPLSRLLRSQAK